MYFGRVKSSRMAKFILRTLYEMVNYPLMQNENEKQPPAAGCSEPATQVPLIRLPVQKITNSGGICPTCRFLFCRHPRSCKLIWSFHMAGSIRPTDTLQHSLYYNIPAGAKRRALGVALPLLKSINDRTLGSLITRDGRWRKNNWGDRETIAGNGDRKNNLWRGCGGTFGRKIQWNGCRWRRSVWFL